MPKCFKFISRSCSSTNQGCRGPEWEVALRVFLGLESHAVDYLLESAISINSIQIPARVKNCNWVFAWVVSVSKLKRYAVVSRPPDDHFRKLGNNGLSYFLKELSIWRCSFHSRQLFSLWFIQVFFPSYLPLKVWFLKMSCLFVCFFYW